MPSAFAPPASRRGRGRGLLVIGLIVLVLLLALGGGALVANASLSSTYSPQRAVTDYFAAQASGNVKDMMSNATYLRGDGSYAQFFGLDAVTLMMAIAENRAIKDVKVTGVREVDSSTSTVTVSMTWDGAPLVHDYTVRKDHSRAHDYFFYSWRVDIPYTTISVTLPNQAGQLEVDHLVLPTGVTDSSIDVIQGYHSVSMLATAFYDLTTQSVNGVTGDKSIGFASTIGPGAIASAASAVKDAFTSCDSAKYDECPNHTYRAPNRAGYIYYLTMPGYPELDYTTYVFTISGDVTTNMKLVIPPETGKVTGSGTCASVLTLNGNRKYKFSGTWTATLTWGGSDFGADVLFECAQSKA